MFGILKTVLAPVEPYIEGLRIALYIGVAIALFGFGWTIRGKIDASALAKLSAQWSDERAKEAATALAIQQQRDAAANQALQAAMDEAHKTEMTLQNLKDQNAKLAQTNTALGSANDKLRNAVAAYASGGSGATIPACAGIAGRARVLGQLLATGGSLFEECSSLAVQGASLASQLGGDAERLADRLRALIQYEQAVNKGP
jgi:hypothetical protein